MRAPPYMQHDQHSVSDSVSGSATAKAFCFSVNPIIDLLKPTHFLASFSITTEFYKPNRYFPFSDVSAGSDIIVYAAIRPLPAKFLVHGGTVQIQPLLSLFRCIGGFWHDCLCWNPPFAFHVSRSRRNCTKPPATFPFPLVGLFVYPLFLRFIKFSYSISVHYQAVKFVLQ